MSTPKMTTWTDKPKKIVTKVDLSPVSGTGFLAAEVVVKFGYDTIDAKVRVLGEAKPTRNPRLSVRTGARLVRGKNGKPMTVPVKVQTTFIECTVGDDTVKARSCCKPPDTFSAKKGIYYAVRHLFRVDSLSKTPVLSRNDRNAIMKAMCPWLYKKTK